jgi:hypothetical protein
MKIGKRLIINVMIMFVGTLVLVATVLKLSHTQISTLASSGIRNLAGKEAREIQIWMEVYLNAARTLAQIMEKVEKQVDTALAVQFSGKRALVVDDIEINREIILRCTGRCKWGRGKIYRSGRKA